jgi:hypothetical protein
LLCAWGVAALAAAISIPGALGYSLWQDEVVSARIIDEPNPVAVARHVAGTESTPPVWYELGWVVHQLGVPVEGVRLLSVLAAAALAGLVVVLGRRLLPLWASTLAGVLVALGNQLVVHGRELRAYELYALLTLAFAAVLASFTSSPTRGRGAAVALTVAAGALTHYWFLLFVATGLGWLWTYGEASRVRLPGTRWIGIGLIPLVAWSPILLSQYEDRRFAWIGPFDADTVLGAHWQTFAGGWPLGDWRLVVSVVFLAIVAAGCATLARRSSEGVLWALFALLPFALGALIWLAGPQIFAVRNLLGAAPFAALAVASLLARLPGRVAVLGVAAALALAVAGAVRGLEAPPAYDRVADALVEQGWRSGDPIVLFGSFHAFRGPLRWYLPADPPLTLARRREEPCDRVFVVSGETSASTRLARAGALPERAVEEILVARVDGPVALTDRMWGGGTLLVSATSSSPCVRTLPESRILRELAQARL